MPNTRDPIDIALGARLRAMRTARRMSLQELGRQIDVTYQQIQKYETGANRIATATLYRIAKAFHCEPADLLVPMPDQEGAETIPALSASRLGLQDAPLPTLQDLPAHVRAPMSALLDALGASYARPRPAAPTAASGPLAH